MKVIETEHSNTQVAKDQPQYLTMPATVLDNGHTITCWELSEQEVQQVIKDRKIYLHQHTFNQPVQPVMIRSFPMLEDFYPYTQRFSDTSLAVSIACLIGKDAPDEFFNLQDSFFMQPDMVGELFSKYGHLCSYLEPIGEIPQDNGVYILGGGDPRNPGQVHFCLYQDGQIVHDPHPANEGTTSIETIYKLIK